MVGNTDRPSPSSFIKKILRNKSKGFQDTLSAALQDQQNSRPATLNTRYTSLPYLPTIMEEPSPRKQASGHLADVEDNTDISANESSQSNRGHRIFRRLLPHPFRPSKGRAVNGTTTAHQPPKSSTPASSKLRTELNSLDSIVTELEQLLAVSRSQVQEKEKQIADLIESQADTISTAIAQGIEMENASLGRSNRNSWDIAMEKKDAEIEGLKSKIAKLEVEAEDWEELMQRMTECLAGRPIMVKAEDDGETRNEVESGGAHGTSKNCGKDPEVFDGYLRLN
jgi:hypothetical protein